MDPIITDLLMRTQATVVTGPLADPQVAHSLSNAIDLTPILLAVISGVFAVILAVTKIMLQRKIRDDELRALLENAVQNSLGVIQQAASNAVVDVRPQIRNVVPPSIAPGVQYVVNHAPEALKRFNITPEKVAEKIVSRIGLQEIKTNLTATASPSPAVVPPLSPVSETAELNRREYERVRAEYGGAS